jgi:hypothetical protein
VIPAPIPGYSIALFRVLALLPFGIAALLMFAGITFAFCAIVLLMQRITQLDTLSIAATFVVSGVLLHAVELGQVVPFAVLGLVAAAYYLRRDDPWRTAAALSLLALQPQFAAGAIAAVFLFAPRMRAAVAALVAVLAIASLAAMPLATNLQYFRDVLPAHVRSELLNEEQFGVPALLVAFGVSPAAALALAPGVALAGLMAGVAAGAALARRFDDPISLALVPPAFALLSGPFVHVHQLAAALPAALAIYVAAPAFRVAVGPILILLAIPWIDYVWGSPAIVAVPAAISAGLAWSFVRRSVAVASAAAILAAAMLLALRAIPPPAAPSAYVLPAPAAATLAEVPWEHYVDLTFRSNPRRYEAGKTISRAGLAGLVIVLCALALKVPRRALQP